MTLSIFPGVLAEDVESEALGGWYPILLIFTFNVADMVSKMSTTFFLFGDRFFISVFTFCRLSFVPFYYFSMRLQAGEAAFFVLTFLLGLSNGYITSASMTVAPRGLPRKEAELVGMISVMFLLLGLTLGAFSSWVWTL